MNKSEDNFLPRYGSNLFPHKASLISVLVKFPPNALGEGLVTVTWKTLMLTIDESYRAVGLSPRE